MENDNAWRAAWVAPATPVQRLVLLALVWSADRSGATGLTLPQMVERTGLAIRTCQRALHELEDAGHITRVHVSGRGAVTMVHPKVGQSAA